MQFLTSAPNFRGGGQLSSLTRPSRAPVPLPQRKIPLRKFPPRDGRLMET